MNSQKDKGAAKAKQLPNENIAGKDCGAYSYETTPGTTSKFAGWSHITLFSETATKDIKSTNKAVKLEENAAVPANKFAAPADYKIQ